MLQYPVCHVFSLRDGRRRQIHSYGVACQMLPKPQSDLWNAYLELENRGLRSQRNDALDRFLNAFAELPTSTQREWTISFAADAIDAGGKTPVRMPFFRRVLLPQLQSAIADRAAGSARWLAGFAQHIYKCTDLRPRLYDGTLTEHGLLLTALEHDSNDVAARRRLLDLLISRLQYTLHELPAGVLYSYEGASIDECRELQSELDDFVHHTEALGVTDDYAGLVADCRFHYNTYSKYLADRNGAACYADFLSQFSDGMSTGSV